MWLAAWPVVAAMALSNEPTPLYVLWQHQIGFTTATLTLIYAGYIAGLLVSLSLGGPLADRYGRRPVLLPGLVLGLVATALFITAHSVAVLGLARLLSGIAVGAVLSAGMAAVSDLAPDGDKRLAGLIASASMVGGAAVGPLLTGVLSQTLPAPAVTVFVVQLFLLLGALLLVPRMPLPPIRADAAAAKGRWLRLPSVPRPHRRSLWVSLAVFAPAITATGFVLSLGPALLAQLLRTDNRLLSGGLVFLLFAAATGVQFAVRRLRVPVLFQVGAALTVVAMAALVTAVALTSVPLLLTAAVLSGLGQGTSQLGGLSTLAAVVPATHLARANAALTAGGYLLAGTLPVAAGYLSDAAGLTAGTTAFGIAVAALAVIGAVAARAHHTFPAPARARAEEPRQIAPTAPGREEAS
ncbi:MFS transporter [Streptomyces sp. NPDC048290]|uniref:MFS transporter n=1 Tax=Streptomyces sp. NPDC048290 TaxID=3155811 RepID=UPI00343605D1